MVGRFFGLFCLRYVIYKVYVDIALSRETNARGYFCLLAAKLFNVLSCFLSHSHAAMCLFFRAFCRTTTQPSAYFLSLSKDLFTY